MYINKDKNIRLYSNAGLKDFNEKYSPLWFKERLQLKQVPVVVWNYGEFSANKATLADKAGIYLVYCKSDDCFYVGCASSGELDVRLNQHLNTKHKASVNLSVAKGKYSIDSFMVLVLEDLGTSNTVTKEILLEASLRRAAI